MVGIVVWYLPLIGLTFIGLFFLLVYVGVVFVFVLFLFILMLINVRVSEISMRYFPILKEKYDI